MQRSLRLVWPAANAAEEYTPIELVTLIKKLRWRGMENEARQMQAVLDKYPRRENEEGAWVEPSHND